MRTLAREFFVPPGRGDPCGTRFRVDGLVPSPCGVITFRFPVSVSRFGFSVSADRYFFVCKAAHGRIMVVEDLNFNRLMSPCGGEWFREFFLGSGSGAMAIAP